MSFLDKVTTPSNSQDPSISQSTGGGFLDRVQTPSGNSGNSLFDLRQQNIQETKRLNELNSFTGILKGGAQGLADTYKNFPSQLAQDVNSGLIDIQNGRPVVGIAKTAFRLAGDTAITLFAPLSAAIGTALKLTGAQTLIDKSGEIIADKSGITDWKAFQDYALSHPNTNKDFERLLMLGLGVKGSRGQFKPTRMVKETKDLANKLVETAQPIIKQGQGFLDKVITPSNKTLGKRQLEGFQKQPLRLNTPAPKFGGKTLPEKTHSTDPIELGAAREKLLIKAGEKPVLDKTMIPIFKTRKITKKTELNKGDIVAIEGVDRWVVSKILAVEQSVKGLRQKVELKNKQGETFTEFTNDLIGGDRVIKTGEKSIKVVKDKPVAVIKEKPISFVQSGKTVRRVMAEDRARLNKAYKTPPVLDTSKVSPETKQISEDIIKNMQAKDETNSIFGIKFKSSTDVKEANKTGDFITKNEKEFLEIMDGKKPLPSDLQAGPMIAGLEALAKIKPSVEIYRIVRDTPLRETGSILAQGLSFFRFVDKQSPFALIRDINESRKEFISKGRTTKKNTTKFKKEISDTIDKASKSVKTTRQGWEDFIKELKCKK